MAVPKKRVTKADVEGTLAKIRDLLEQEVDHRTVFDISRVGLGFRVRLVSQMVADLTDFQVRGGPFAGLRYVRRAIGSLYAPKLLGTYEQELAPIFNDLNPYTTFIDIGCAEGYYAIGAAYAAPHLRVVAVDTNTDVRGVLDELAELNGVADRLEFHAGFDRAACGDLEPAKTLVLIDIEGTELELLPELLATDLVGATFVIETHVVKGESTGNQIAKTLEPGHVIERIAQAPRAPELIPDIRELNQFERFLCVWEGRNAEGWIVARPR